MWAAGTAAITGTLANTNLWMDTSSFLAPNKAADDATRIFCWSWTSYVGLVQGWSYGASNAPAGVYSLNRAGGGGYGITRANVYVEC